MSTDDAGRNFNDAPWMDGNSDSNSGEVPPWEEPDNPHNQTPTSPSAEDDIEDTDIVPLYKCVQSKEDYGLVGEDYTFLVMLTGTAAGGGPIGMVAMSRSGKDFLTDCVKAHHPNPDRTWAKVPNSIKEAALYRMRGELNSASVHRYMDLVDLEPHIEDILKQNGEGDTAVRRIGVGDGGKGDETQTFKVYPPDALLFYLAADNSRVSLSDFPEVRNRALILSTDASQGLTEEIQRRQGLDVAGMYDYNLSPGEIQDIRNHVGSIPTEYNVSQGTTDFFNPCGYPFNEESPVPSNFVEGRHDNKRMYKYARIVTLWHHQNRMQVPYNGRGGQSERWMVTPKDMWIMMRVFGEKLVMSALSLRDLHLRLLWFMRENPEEHTVSFLNQIVQQAGWNVTPSSVRDACDDLVEKNYVQKDDNGTVTYRALGFASSINVYEPVDWAKVIDMTKEAVEHNVENGKLDRADADEYIERFCTRPITARHPVDGRKLDIEEYTGFEEQVKQRENDLEQMLGTSIYDSSDEDEESDDAEKAGADSNGGLSEFSFGDD